MTVSSTNRKAGPFLGDGVNTLFPFAYKVFKKSDVRVTHTNLNGADAELGLDSDYSVALNPDQNVSPGGVVTYPRVGSSLAVLPAGERLTLTGSLVETQPTDLPNPGPFFAQVVEDALDRDIILIQQLQEEVDRSIKISVSDAPLAPLPTASARANTVIGFDAIGGVVTIPLPASVGAGDMRLDSFNSGVDFVAGVTTQVTVSRPPGNPANVEVFFDGFFQGPDQWSVSGSIVTFNTPIPVGVSKVYIRLGTTLSTQIPPVGSVGDPQITWPGILLRVVDSISALRQLDKNRYDRAFSVGYHQEQDGGGGDYVLDSLDTTSADNGGTVIVANDGGRWKLRYYRSVCVTQFGAKLGDLTFDSSSAFNALLADASTKVYAADFGSGTYYASQINVISGRLHIIGSCEILGAVSGSFAYQCQFKNVVDLRVDGRILWGGRYNIGYASGVKIWADTGVASLIDISGFSFSGHRNAWQFGDPAQPDKQVSEISVRGGYTFGCPIAFSTYGSQTFVAFSGYQIRSSYGDGAGAWLALSARVGLINGGHVTISSDCEVLMTEIITGAGFELDAIVSPLFGNQYGVIKIMGAVMECASPFVITGNPNAVASPQAGLIEFDGVTGIHTQNAGALIQTDASFIGDIIVSDNNNIYATVARTQLNVACSGNANVYVGDHGFGRNCLQGLAGISGGVLHFSRRVILRVFNLAGQSFPVGTSTAKWQSADNTGDLVRFSASYSAANGAFTFPQAFKKVTVRGGLFISGFAAGSTYLTKLNTGGTATLGVQAANGAMSASLGDVAAGNFVFVDVSNAGGGAVAAGSNTYDFFEIEASN